MPQPTPVRAWRWSAGSFELLDQRVLPQAERWLTIDQATAAAEAIRAMVVRGAPAIGIVAAYAIAIEAARGAPDQEHLAPAFALLAESRPTAVNLFWALERMRQRLAAGADAAGLLAEAQAIEAEDLAANQRMGALGAAYLASASVVYTHCNTGSLATAGHGTALGVIRSAWAEGRLARVYAGETRPWLQGARLTSWELLREGLPVLLACDSAAGHLLATAGVDWLIVGADRITARGDVANKIGTAGLAALARHHGVRCMVVAPTSSIDPQVVDGRRITIEERPAEEVSHWAGQPVAAPGVPVVNPAFDITPAELVDVLVTEAGCVERPDEAAIAALLAGRPA